MEWSQLPLKIWSKENGPKLYIFALPFSSAVTDAIKATMMAFLSIASLSCATIAVLSAAEHVPIVKVGALQLVTTSADAGF